MNINYTFKNSEIETQTGIENVNIFYYTYID